MPRIARVVAPGIPHHITQRGNRRMRTFFCEADYLAYIDLMAEWCGKHGVEIWAYCLMPNHVHLIVVPPSEDALRRAIGEAHRRYSRMINFREKWRGHLWQGRFASYPMDEAHLFAAARYVERNPVRAGLVERAEDYLWSSAAAHVHGVDVRLCKVRPLLDLIPTWREFLGEPSSEKEDEKLRSHERTGRPAGDDAFVERIGQMLGRNFAKKKPGPKAPRMRRKRPVIRKKLKKATAR